MLAPTAVGAGFPKGLVERASLLENQAKGKPLVERIKRIAGKVLAFLKWFGKEAWDVLKKYGRGIARAWRWIARKVSAVIRYIKVRPALMLGMLGVVYFAGIAAVVYPMFSPIYSLSTAKTVIDSYNETVTDLPSSEMVEIYRNAQQYNTDLANGVTDSPYSMSLNQKDKILCFIEVPSIEVYLPVYYGTTETSLNKGCGWVRNTSLPIGGASTHCVISGHTGLPAADMLTRLDEVKEGDTFYIHVLDRILAYQVDDIKVVLPQEVENLNIIAGEDHVTLLTCTPYGLNTHRLLVRGIRTAYVRGQTTAASDDEIPIQIDNDSAEKGLDAEILHRLVVIIGIGIVAVVVYAFSCIWLFKELKHRIAVASGIEEDEILEDDESDAEEDEE